MKNFKKLFIALILMTALVSFNGCLSEAEINKLSARARKGISVIDEVGGYKTPQYKIDSLNAVIDGRTPPERPKRKPLIIE